MTTDTRYLLAPPVSPAFTVDPAQGGSTRRVHAPTPSTASSPETLSQAGFPTISYETLRLGDEFRSEDREIRPEDVEAYAFAVEDHDPRFFGPGPFGLPIAHPTFLANQALMLRRNHYFVPAGLQARMIFEAVNVPTPPTRA